MNRKMKNIIIIFFLVCSIFASLLVTPLTDTAKAAWYGSEWNYRRIITINQSFISSDFTDFPLLVPINSTIAQRCNDNGSDLIFGSLDNTTTFTYHVEGEWNQSATNYVWVNISETISSTADYQFYFYYNNSNATPSQNVVGTYDSNFICVQHMNETTGQHLDMTSNNNDSTAISVFKQGNATGISDGCDDFESGDADYINMSDVGDLNTFTIEVWFYVESLSATMELLGKTGEFDCMVYSTGYTYFGMDVGGTCTGNVGDVDIGAWYYFVATHDGTNIHVILGNTTAGTVLGEGSGAVASNLDSDYQIGNRLDGAVPFDGLIDEFRISDIERSDAYINATYHAINQSTGFLTIGAELDSEEEDLLEPTSFIATTESNTQINLSWVQGVNATHTYIMQKTTGYPDDRDDGTNIYNDTGTYYTDSSLTSYTAYYYRAWSFNSTTGNWSTSYSSATNHTGPANPTSVDSTISNSNVNFTWTTGARATQTVLTRKVSSYPSNVDDGTKLYNGSNEYYVDSITAGAYYRLFSYDNATGLYSTGADADWGALTINCYDEETNESIDFDVLVNNEDGTQTYENTSCTNPAYLDLNELPLGDNIRIEISATSSVINKTQVFTGYANNTNASTTQVILLQDPNSKSTTNVTTTNTTSAVDSYPPFILDGDIITIPADAVPEFDEITVTYQHDEYEPRTYFRDFVANQYYILNAYLPNADDSELYRITIEDYFGIAINDALIDMKVSVSGVFVTASSLLTDGNGNADMFLLPGTTYLFSISKTGYITTHGTWRPSTAAFTKTFKILAEETNITTVTFGDLITFTGEWITANNTLRIYFNDKDDNTTDVTFSIYESYGVNLTLTNRTTFGSITTTTLYFSGLNTSRMHQIRLEMNHTKLGHILNQTIHVSPIRDDDRASETWLEMIITLVMGDFDYGYVVFAMLYSPCLLLIVTFGAVKQPGLGVLFAGLYIILVTWRIELANTQLFAIASLFILFGMIMIIVKHGTKLAGRKT